MRGYRYSGILLVLALAGCASVPGAYQAQGSGWVEQGVVREVRPVAVQAKSGWNEGTLVGGAVGTAAGLALTRHAGGSAEGLGAVLGGVAGGAVGQSLGNRQHPGVLVIVQVGRQLISVVQDGGAGLYPGEAVYIVRDGAQTRVVGQ